MRKAEREKIQEAIALLMLDDDEGGSFDRGVGMLCELVGWRYPAYHDTKDLRPTSIEEITRGGNREFRPPRKP